jgi:cell wall-associated NlpC family hydrolase
MRAGRGRLLAVARTARQVVLRPALATLLVLPLLAAAPASTLAEQKPVAPDHPAPGRSNGRAAASITDLPAPEPPSPPAGEIIVETALAYVGYPYAAGGNSPAGFDCSGFTQFVVLMALGLDIGHGLPGQTAAGWWVDWGAWLPGDLVFFANTYQPGLSHAGIYVGDGLFIHAGDEATGVLISSMYEEYYAGRYYGAVRIA